MSRDSLTDSHWSVFVDKAHYCFSFRLPYLFINKFQPMRAQSSEPLRDWTRFIRPDGTRVASTKQSPVLSCVRVVIRCVRSATKSPQWYGKEIVENIPGNVEENDESRSSPVSTSPNLWQTIVCLFTFRLSSRDFTYGELIHKLTLFHHNAVV